VWGKKEKGCGGEAPGIPPPPAGEVTSGTFSPTLNRSIALARVPKNDASGVMVEIRGKMHAASIVKPPFVRHGKTLIPAALKGDVH
jgi:glycine cleavage system aminomethyltransferase T